MQGLTPPVSSWRAGSRVAPLALLLLLAACGGSGGDEPAGDGATAPEAEEEATEDAATEQEAATESAPATAEPTEGESSTEAAGASSALEGETIDFVIPYEPGGGYDQYVRLVAPFLGDCLGAEVVPLNEPGAGTLLATNQTAVAPPDGTRIQIMNAPGVLGAQIAGIEGVSFDLTEMSWLGRLAAEPSVLSVAADSEFTDFQDIIDADRPVRFVSTGPGSVETISPLVLAEVYSFQAEVIPGFAGSGEARAAVVAGDADAHVQTLDSALPAIEAGDIRPLVFISREGSEAAADVPTVYDFPPADDTQQETLEVLVELTETGRPVASAPGLPPDVLTALREGFTCALEDEEFLAQAEEAQRPVGPLTGEETASLMDTVLNAPEQFRQLVEESF